MGWKFILGVLGLGLGLWLALMAGCGREPETTFKVLAGSELRDLEQLA